MASLPIYVVDLVPKVHLRRGYRDGLAKLLNNVTNTTNGGGCGANMA
jgi:hypothetical protein